MEYFLLEEGVQTGPFSAEELRERVDGGLALTTLAWREGLSEWKTLSHFVPPPIASLPSEAESVSPQEPQPKMSTSDWILGCTVILVPLIALGAIAVFLLNSCLPDPAKNNGADNASLAIAAAKDIVIDNLKAPASARFVSEEIVTNEYPWYQIVIVVDAQNEFGALIRNEYLCTFKLKDDGGYAYTPFVAFRDWDPVGKPLLLPSTLSFAKESDADAKKSK